MSRAIIVLSVMVSVACGEHPPAYFQLLPEPAKHPPSMREACELAATRCTQCHPIDRALMTNRVAAPQWDLVVRRMRLKPSSGISEDEAVVIVDCLVNRDRILTGATP